MVGLSWQEHIQSIMLYCIVHFYKGIQERFSQHEQYFQMRAPPELHSKEACLKLLTELAKIPELVRFIFRVIGVILLLTNWYLGGMGKA